MKNSVYEIVTDRIIEALNRGVVPWRKTWNGSGISCDYSQYNYSARGIRPYHGINVFLLTGRYASPYWMTYRQAAALGGNVRRGERGSVVVFWKKDERETGKDSTGKTITEKRFILRYYSVFNLEQIDGIAPPAADVVETIKKPSIISCDDLLQHMPERPHIINDDRAYYSPLRDVIGCPDISAFDKPESYYATLYHECVHWSGASSRLDRPGLKSPHFGSEQYSKEELVAEMGSAFMCDMTGISSVTLENSAAYIASWLRALKNDRTLVIHAAGAAERAVSYIINGKRKDASATETTTSEPAAIKAVV